VVSSQDNVGNPRTQLRSTASQDKNAMKSVMRMLERYEWKLSRTVLRRGGASNRLLLSLRFIKVEIAEGAEFKTRAFQTTLGFSNASAFSACSAVKLEDMVI